MSREPRVTYLVCATHRSGSNLLCQLLWHSGRAGFPQEAFSPTRMGPISEQHDLGVDPERDFRGYLAALLAQRQTSNGVFGAKMMWTHLDSFCARLGLPVERPFAAIESVLPEARYVWMRRRDAVRQAISMVKAKQTGVYNSLQERAGEVSAAAAYDFEAIDKQVRRFQREDQAWEARFREAAVAPHEVFYEDLTTRTDEVLRDVLRFLGLEAADDFRAPPVHYRRLSDETNDDWDARYRAAGAPKQRSSPSRTPIGE
jgi:LPS sulfotransferase NodH